MKQPEKILIISSPAELKAIQKARPEVKSVPLILLSSGFNSKQLEQFEGRGYHYFDDLIDEKDAQRMAEVIYKILWNWFFDENGKDLSLIDGCSLGSVFISSFDVLLNSILRYEVGLTKLLNSKQQIYYSSNTEELFLIIIEHLQKQIGFKVNVVETSTSQEIFLYGKEKLKFYPSRRTRDLSPFFLRMNYKGMFISSLLKWLQPKNNNGKRILIVSAGKLNDYFDYLKKRGSFNELEYILPLSKSDILTLLSLKRRNALFYYFYSGIDKFKYKRKISCLISNLKRNIIREIKDIAVEVLVPIMEKHIFRYFYGAFSYYKNVLKMMISLQPNLVILSADGFENFILIAQAAKKVGTRTAFIPHGLYGWGYSEYKSGPAKIFDYGLALGKKDVLDYKRQGMEQKRIIISSHPYFSRFLECSHRKSECNKNSNYKKALILLLDCLTIFPGERIGRNFAFIREVIKMLKELKIKIIGIKARELYDFHYLGMKEDYVEYAGERIPLVAGYDSFSEVAKEADLIIGPPTTAIIEAGLLGKDYFLYCPGNFYETVSSLVSVLYKMLKTASCIEELKDNILSGKPYRYEYSVFDLVDLKGAKDKLGLYQTFENVLLEIINNKSSNLPL